MPKQSKPEKTASETMSQAGFAISPKVPKHQVVFDYLHSSIESGVYKPGDRLPSEAELGKMFDASRITVAKAVLELQRMNLVTRRPGAGTHVQTKEQPRGYTFGLLIPELGLTEIFDPICHGMMRSPFARPNSLLWGNASGVGVTDLESSKAMSHMAEEALEMAHNFIAQKVSGVFLDLAQQGECIARMFSSGFCGDVDRHPLTRQP